MGLKLRVYIMLIPATKSFKCMRSIGSWLHTLTVD
jgi:hypothetical protein